MMELAVKNQPLNIGAQVELVAEVSQGDLHLPAEENLYLTLQAQTDSEGRLGYEPAAVQKRGRQPVSPQESHPPPHFCSC